MSFMSKLENLAKTAGEKAGGAVEVTKLNAQLLSQKKKISDAKETLGDLVYSQFVAGEQFGEDIMAQCRAVQEAADALEKLQAQERSARDGLLDKDQQQILCKCPACSYQNSPGSDMCQNCGAPLRDGR